MPKRKKSQESENSDVVVDVEDVTKEIYSKSPSKSTKTTSPQKSPLKGSRRSRRLHHDSGSDSTIFVCDICFGTQDENSIGEPEDLITCSECNLNFHPSCLDFTDRLVSVVQTYSWHCGSCKTCMICKTAENDDQLLLCDNCDKGFHMFCLQPKLEKAPQGLWSCQSCLEKYQKDVELESAQIETKELDRESKNENKTEKSEKLKGNREQGMNKTQEKLGKRKKETTKNIETTSSVESSVGESSQEELSSQSSDEDLVLSKLCKRKSRNSEKIVQKLTSQSTKIQTGKVDSDNEGIVSDSNEENKKEGINSGAKAVSARTKSKPQGMKMGREKKRGRDGKFSADKSEEGQNLEETDIENKDGASNRYKLKAQNIKMEKEKKKGRGETLSVDKEERQTEEAEFEMIEAASDKNNAELQATKVVKEKKRGRGGTLSLDKEERQPEAAKLEMIEAASDKNNAERQATKVDKQKKRGRGGTLSLDTNEETKTRDTELEPKVVDDSNNKSEKSSLPSKTTETKKSVLSQRRTYSRNKNVQSSGGQTDSQSSSSSEIEQKNERNPRNTTRAIVRRTPRKIKGSSERNSDVSSQESQDEGLLTHIEQKN